MPDVVRIELKENGISYRVHPVYDQTTAHIQKMVFEQRDRYQAQNRVNRHGSQSIGESLLVVVVRSMLAFKFQFQSIELLSM